MIKNPAPALGTVEQTLFYTHPAVARALAPYIKTRTHARHETVLPHGEQANTLWLVLKGWVKLTRQTPDGKETIVGLCTEGDLFGEAALFAHANYPYNAEILADDTQLATIPADTVRRLILQDQTLSTSIMALLGERLLQAQLKLEHMSTLSAAQRLGCFLLRLCHTHEQNRHLKIPIEKHILAAYLGMKPETLSRSQQQLKPLGVTISGHDIVIGDVDKLRVFVCGSCSESGACDAEGGN